MNQQRVRVLKDGPYESGAVVYWMSRDQRMRDNWALIFAQRTALERKTALHVVFSLAPHFLGATMRQYGFMLKGLKETAEDLAEKNIAFHLLTGPPEVTIPEFVRRQKIGALVTDFDPLRIKREWHDRVASSLSLPFYEVDTHNIVPCRIASQKQEYAAYTFRPKIHRALREFLEDFPPVRKHPFLPAGGIQKVSWEKATESLEIDRSVKEVQGIKPGERQGRKVLNDFIEKRLSKYDKQRNDPSQRGQSLLSPYLHFGQISPQRVALEVLESTSDKESKKAFLEELIVRRELSDNFCFYNLNYDRCEGFPAWARETLEIHRGDRRSHLYSRKAFEQAQTHDPLWNAAQIEMVRTGRMHGYMRMYWAKKILEWTESPEEALETAIYLNDRYELDGRDPNGYTGIAWSIGGVHDRAWSERKVFGKIRYMSYQGCRSKFDVDGYVKMFRQ